MDIVVATFGEYQTITPSLKSKITTQILQSSEIGNIFGEYQTMSIINGIKSRCTHSIEPTPIQA